MKTTVPRSSIVPVIIRQLRLAGHLQQWDTAVRNTGEIRGFLYNSISHTLYMLWQLETDQYLYAFDWTFPGFFHAWRSYERKEQVGVKKQG